MWVTLEDFVSIIHQKIKPSRKRELRAEILTGSLNWKAYYDQYDIYMSGLVKGPKSTSSVNHCWRFIRRSDTNALPSFLFLNMAPMLIYIWFSFLGNILG